MGYIGRDNRVSTFTKQSITADGGTSFTLNQGVGDSSSVMVSIGGVVQQPDVAYTAAGTSLTFTSAPTNAYPIWVIYLGKELTVASETNFDNVASQTGVGDGTTTPVTLSNSVSSVQSIIVTLNGISQVPTTDFTVSGTTLTFTTAPSAAMAILIYYIDLAVAENVVSDETVMVSSLASTGTWPAWNGSALTGMVGASDITKLHDDIALLHFLRSIDSSSKIANMIEGWSDTFPNTTSVVDGSLSVPLAQFSGYGSSITYGDRLTLSDASSGITDSLEGTVSFWWDATYTDDASYIAICDTTSTGFRINRHSSADGTSANGFSIFARFGSPNATKLNATTTSAWTASSGLIHVMVSWKIGGVEADRRCQWVINGEVQTNAAAITLASTAADMTTGTFYIGNNQGGYSTLQGGLGQFYFIQDYIDLSVQANREKFVSGTGANVKAVDFGTDGSTPFGTAPIIYLNNPYATFHNNLGSGGNFTVTASGTSVGLADGGYVGDKLYSSTNFSNSYELIDEYGGAIQRTTEGFGPGRANDKIYQTFRLASATNITKIGFSCREFGSISGNMTVEIQGHTGTYGVSGTPDNNIHALANFNVDTGNSVQTDSSVTFSEPVYLAAGDYSIVWNCENISSNGSNYFEMAVGGNFGNPNPGHSGNEGRHTAGSGYAAEVSQDVVFSLNGSKNFTLTTKGSDSLTATSPASAPTNGYFQALISENPVSGTSVFSDTLDTDEAAGIGSWAIRQRFTPSAVGTKIRVKIEAPSTSILGLANVSIGKAVGGSYATHSTPLEFLFGGSSGCVVTAGGTLLSDWLTFDMDEIVSYLVTFDYLAPAATSNIRKVTTGGAGYIISQGLIFNSASAGNVLSSSLTNTTHTALLSGIEVGVNPTINTDYIAEMSRDGGTTYSPAVLSRVTDVVAGSADRIVQGDVSFTGDPSGTNMVGRIRTVDKNKVTVKAMGINWD